MYSGCALSSEEGPGGHRGGDEAEQGLDPAREIRLGGMPGRVQSIRKQSGGIWLAQPADHATLDLRITSPSPTLGMEPAQN